MITFQLFKCVIFVYKFCTNIIIILYTGNNGGMLVFQKIGSNRRQRDTKPPNRARATVAVHKPTHTHTHASAHSGDMRRVEIIQEAGAGHISLFIESDAVPISNVAAHMRIEADLQCPHRPHGPHIAETFLWKA